MTTDLESTVIEQLKSGQCSVERALLVVSGLETEEDVAEYQRRLDRIKEGFCRWQDIKKNSFAERAASFLRNAFGIPTSEEYQTAEALFDYL